MIAKMSKSSSLAMCQHTNLVGAKDHKGKGDRTSVEIERHQKENRKWKTPVILQ
jgi:hypothetical protein